MTKILIPDRRRVILFILTMTAIAVGAAKITILVLTKAAFEQQPGRLVETAQNRAQIIEAAARFDAHEWILISDA